MNPFKRYTRTVLVYGSKGSYNAAAIAGVVAGGWPDYDDETEWSKPEKTRPGNPSELTINQHVYPKKSITRFANCAGRVEVYDLIRKKPRKAKPSDAIFCARRAWDQRSESGYMREIEDQFQELADRTISNQEGVTRVLDKRVVGRFFALWYMRSRYSQLKDQEYKLNGIEGDHITLEREENLERDHYIFVRSGGRIPSRQVNGILLQQKIDQFSEDLESVASWGLITPQSGEFIVPDVPYHPIISLRPDLALVGNVQDGSILRENLNEINQAAVTGSRSYCFARSFDECPREV